jgi:enamine deaminase RidA (YjgF/YER057c/UK114 family)
MAQELTVTPEEKLKELGLHLPELRPKAGNYLTSVKTGNLLFLSGSLSFDFVGRVGGELSIEEGYKASKAAALQSIASLKHELGELSKIKKIVKLLGFINTDPSFTQHATVMNGASDLFISVFGKEVGTHARTTIGGMLPRNIALEIEMILEVSE